MRLLPRIMIDEKNAMLFQHICDKCQRRYWYGADAEVQRKASQIVTSGFVSLPATEKQLDMAELALGFTPIPFR
jgi:hypothetical protein